MTEKYIDIDTGQVYENTTEALNARKDKQQEAMQREQNKNPTFIQLSHGVSPDIIAKIADENAGAVRILMFFFKNMSKKNVIMVSQQTIEDSLGISKRSISRAIKVLEANEAIAIGKISNTNVYLVNPAVAWQSANKFRNSAILDGAILLGKNENEDLFTKFNKIYNISEENSLKLKTVSTNIIQKEGKQEPKPYEPTEEQIVQDEKAQQLYEDFEENFLTPEEQDIEDMV